MSSMLLVGLALGAGCTVDIADYADRLCDDAHGCLEGWSCQAGRCVQEGTDSGVPDSGTEVQTGCVRWRQVDGFSSTAACPTCTLSVDAAQQNQLSAMVDAAADGLDSATALITGSALDGLGSGGKLRGRIFVPSELRLEDDSTFLELRTSTGAPLLELYFTHGWELGLTSAAGMLQSTGVNAESLARFDSGTVRQVEVQWQRGAFARALVDGTNVVERTLTPVTGETSFPEVTELRLGIVRYAGDAEEGWTAVLSEWVLCNDPNGELEP
ncbi:MAG: hypothetical protein WBV82_18450 [Myxococcaceae bacterium]